MTLLTAGYWHTTYFPSRYWQQDYWLEYGTYVPPVPTAPPGIAKYVAIPKPLPLPLEVLKSLKDYLELKLLGEKHG